MERGCLCFARYFDRGAAALAGQSPAAMVRTLNEALLREYGGGRLCTVAIARRRVAAAGAA